MPNNTLEKWEEKTLEEVCNINYGTRVVKSRDAGSIYPVYGGGGATFCMDTYNRENCMVVARFAMSEKCTRFVKGKFFLNDSGLTVETKDSLLNQNFLDWQLVSLNDKIYSLGRGSAQKNLNVDLFKKLKIRFPLSKIEQQRIVGILDEAFEKIEKAKQNTIQNLNNAKELFESKSNNIFKNLLTTSNNVKMSDITDLITKGASPKWQGFEYCEKSTDSILFITSENVGKEELLLDNRKYLGKEFNEKQRRSILEKGDILTNIVGASIGRTTIFDLEDVCNINQAVCLIRLKDKESAKYITKYMNSITAIESMIGMIKDCARANVSLTNIADLYVPMPNIEEQQQIVQQLDELQEQTKKLEQIYTQKLKDLDELKQSILQKAFNGEL